MTSKNALFGWQLAAVSYAGEVLLDEAGGADALGRPIGPASLLPAYCCVKPLLGAMAATLVADGTIDLDAPLAGYAPWIGGSTAAEVPLGDVLFQRAGLRLVHPMRWFGRSRARRAADLAATTLLPDAGLRFEDVACWATLDAVVSATTGRSASAQLRARVLEPAGIGGEFVERVERMHWPSVGGSFAVDGTVFGDDHLLPNLVMVTPEWACDDQPHINTRASARALARGAALVGAALAGQPSPFLDARGALERVLVDRPLEHDPVHRADMRLGLGCMTPLRNISLPSLPEVAFGYRSWGASGALWCDPDAGMAGAVLLCGLSWGDTGGTAGNARLDRAAAAVYDEVRAR